MKHNKYISRANDSFLLYQFTSEGTKGSVRKQVIYSATSAENIYNLAFGDYDPLTKTIDDFSITDNGDSFKVLATVASTVITFTERYPKAWILVMGSTPSRTRLYRMGITNNLAEISEDFAIFGYNCERQWVRFAIGEGYDAFLITKKENGHTS
ncbi:DUF6934 family protein [Dyadobacter fanqingshengii]|uniref:Uncharacterized protein n=1 Tax=Dyadobacter fanqingshengii TaxID=2906443 RepID=A0A9X1P6D3_9BACT|nr:hypothetical protein [Dyadobacter fanqingshengii]MCF0038792.1 hypothetical protein [Dyadobacter fanqingshengii]USJ34380.1 hypothetical protein NFI81_16885 [Dyadobacter fanqingshengii]